MPARRKPADGIVLRIDLPLLGMRKHKGEDGSNVLLRGGIVRRLPHMILPDHGIEAELVEARRRRKSFDERTHIPIPAARQDENKGRPLPDEEGV